MHDATLPPGRASVVIWTTTPWTLPANQAVAVHPEFEYVLVEVGTAATVDTAAGGHRASPPSELLLLAADLAASVLARAGIPQSREVARARGAALEGLQLRHPFYDRAVPVILGDHVTLDAGTGAVHTAPGHGLEDFIVGRQLRPRRRQSGRRRRALPARDAAVRRREGLRGERARHRGPGRARRAAAPRGVPPQLSALLAPQDAGDLPRDAAVVHQHGAGGAARRGARAKSAGCDWTPDWGEQRIDGMIAGRPDWCISRQRTWGVPIALFVHRETGELHPRTPELIEQVARASRRTASTPGSISMPRSCSAPKPRATRRSPTSWTSGSIPACRITASREPARDPRAGGSVPRGLGPASRLVPQLAADLGRAERPRALRGVLTHGFTVDEKGRKMSKSLGNVIAPQKVRQHARRRRAAPLGRRDRLRERDERVGRDPEAHGGFLPAHAQHRALPARQPARLRSGARRRAGRAAWWRSTAGRSRARANCRTRSSPRTADYDFHLIYQKVHNFCVVDLGGFYLDMHQGPAVHDAAAGHRAPLGADRDVLHRRGDGALARADPVLHGRGDLARPAGRARRVGVPVARGPKCRCPCAARGHRLGHACWWRCAATSPRELERLRVAGEIGAPLDAEVDALLHCGAGPARWHALGDELRFLLITSEARVARRRSRAAPTRGRPESTAERRALAPRAPPDAAEVRALLAPARGRRRRTPRTRICARAASATSTGRAKRGASHDGMDTMTTMTPPPDGEQAKAVPAAAAVHPHHARMFGDERTHPAAWLWLSVSVIALDQVTRPGHPFPRRLPARRSAAGARYHALHNTGAAFSILADASGWQRWLLHRARRCGQRDLVAWLLAPAARRAAAADRARAHPRRRARQRHRPRLRTATWSTSSTCTGAARTSRPSTSPTPRSRSAPCC